MNTQNTKKENKKTYTDDVYIFTEEKNLDDFLLDSDWDDIQGDDFPSIQEDDLDGWMGAY